MDISRAEQRILHLLAQGGRIEIERNNHRKVITVTCFTRDGWQYARLDIVMFKKLKKHRAIASKSGAPYQITRRGLQLVRSELNNR